MWNLKFFSLNLTLWTKSQTDPANPTTMIGWTIHTIQTDRTNLTTQTGRAGVVTHTGWAGPMTQMDRVTWWQIQVGRVWQPKQVGQAWQPTSFGWADGQDGSSGLDDLVRPSRANDPDGSSWVGSCRARLKNLTGMTDRYGLLDLFASSR